ncbi:MAG: hypothetical protein L0271_00575 [Gemmatimonadetes bacterium]|nr:hypothetical protein [Gemmatimonadota bacterium]
MPILARLVLLLVAAVAYAAGGAALAIVRSRGLADGSRDGGMTAVGLSLICIGALCTTAGVGTSGVLAFGGVTVWASYVITAERLGVFRVQIGHLEEEAFEEPRRHA